jgi:hypothetical protein
VSQYRERRSLRSSEGLGFVGVLAVIVVLGLAGGLGVLSLESNSRDPGQLSGATPMPGATQSPATIADARTIDQVAVAACQEVQAELQSALELYAVSNGGAYPARLQNLVPKWLKTDPEKSLGRGQTLTYSAVSGVVSARCQ